MTAPRRFRHYMARAAYGAGLFVLMWTAWQAVVGFQRVDSVGDVARFGVMLFRFLSIVQVALALFFAPIVAASSISTEKDRRTFDLLLMTDLTNWEIVIGKLLSSLLQMAVLLASALPLFTLCLLLGGASFEQVGRVFLVTAAAALASGSLAVLIASWRDKTFQTLALTLLIIVLYFAMVIGLFGLWGNAGFLADSTPLGFKASVWSAMVNPLESIATALTTPIDRSGSGLAVEWMFVGFMLALTVVLVGTTITTLRRWNPGGGRPTHAREAIEEMERKQAAEAKDRPRKAPRPIWDNPILWREICTQGYGTRPFVIKLAYLLACALIGGFFYFATRDSSDINRMDIAKAFVPIAVISLILVNMQAVTAITSERDGRALDLLLVTDVSPKEFIFGKIFGVLYNAKEMVIVPLAMCIYLLTSGYLGWEVWFYLIGGILVLVTFAITLGLHTSLAYEQTRAAIITSLGTIAFLFIGTLICIFLILVSGVSGQFWQQAASFVLFICLGAVGMYAVLAVRNPSGALALATSLCPIMTYWAVTQFFLAGDPLGSFLVVALTYSFAVLAMLVPAVSEFDVALGRTVAADG